MRRPCSGWPGSSNRSGPGRTDYLRYVLKLRPKSATDGQSAAIFGNEGRHGAATGTLILLTTPRSGGLIVTQSDPTDNALVAIASILDRPESHREPENA